MARMIYSNSLNKLVVTGFTVKRVYFYRHKSYRVVTHHFTWNDSDCIYYRDDVDVYWYDELPEEGRVRRPLTLAYNCTNEYRIISYDK